MVVDAQLPRAASARRRGAAGLLGRLPRRGAGRRGAGEVAEVPGRHGSEGGTPISGRQQAHPEARPAGEEVMRLGESGVGMVDDGGQHPDFSGSKGPRK